MKPLDPRLIKHAASVRTFLTFAVVNGTVTSAAVIAQAVVLGDLLSGVFSGSKTRDQVAHSLVLLLLLFSVRTVTSWIGEWSANRTSARAKQQLRRSLARKIFDLGPIWVGRNRSSELVTTAMRGLDSLDVYFSRYLPQLVLAAIIPLSVGITVLTNDLLSAVIIAFTVPLIPFFMALVGWFTQAQVDKQWQSLQRLSGHFLDLITGLPTLKAFNRSRGQSEGLRTVGEDYRSTTMSVLRISFLSSFVLELISTISVALVAVSIGLRLVNGTMHLREGLIILILVPEAYLPLRALGTQFHAMTEGLEAADRVFTILDHKVSNHEGTEMQEPIRSIAFRDVSVTYPNANTPALVDFSGQFEPGSLSVITGVSGSGKTTALAVLLKFVVDYQGSIAINGHELREIETRSWRNQIAYLPQSPWLPHGTVREALVMAAPADDAALIALCRTVDLDLNDAEQFPQGLNTVVSSNSGLSSGQRHRLGLARALLQERPILILDEPTAAVDAATEALIAEIITSLTKQGKLVIAVAHRPSLIAQADVVVNVQEAVMTS